MEEHAKAPSADAPAAADDGAIAELKPEPRPRARPTSASDSLPVEASRSTAPSPVVMPARVPLPPARTSLPPARAALAKSPQAPSITVTDTRPRAAAARARPSVAIEGSTVARYGDRAGEHLQMERGRFDAWIHVVIAYLFEVALLGALPGLGLYYALGLVVPGTTIPSGIGAVVGVLFGGALAWLAFRDRWRCIEAFSSRFCSGVANLSLMYVPFVALAYANVRAVAKRRGE